MSESLRPHGLQPTGLLHPWDFPGNSTGVGCYCLLLGRVRSTHRDSAHLYAPRNTVLSGIANPAARWEGSWDPFDFVAEIREWSPRGVNDLSTVSLSMGVKPE